MNAQVKGRKKLSATDARNLRTLLLLNVLAPEEIGARIAQARVEAGLTQPELADLVGASLRSVQGWEAGAVKPYRWLEALAAATGVTVAWLLHGDQDELDPAQMVKLAEDAAETREMVARALRLLEQLAAGSSRAASG